MAQPSKAGAIVLFLFGLPFFAFGAYATFAFYTSAPSVHNNSNPVAAAIFASVFAIIGAGIMFGSVYGYWWLKRNAAVKDANPQSPWLWRSDWAQGRALSSRRGVLYGWWVGAVLASMLFVPMAVITVPPMVRSGDTKAFFLLGLCLIPAALLAGALRATIRRQRYGQTYFEFATLPFAPGKRMSGQIHLRLDTAAEHGIDVRLSCIRRIETGVGNEHGVANMLLWQQEKNLTPGSLMIGQVETSIPVEFEIPEEVYETNHDVSSDQVLWMLTAKADMPGVNYSAEFEIPVFRTTAKAARASASSGDVDWAPASRTNFPANAPVSDSLAVSVPAHPKVVVSITTQGATEFYFPAFRNRGRTLFLLLFTAGWTALVYFLAHSDAPRAFPVVFGLFDVMLVYGCMQGLFGRARIVVGNGKLISQRGTFSTGAAAEIPFSDIEFVRAVTGVQNSNAWSASYSIQLGIRSGSTPTLVDNIANSEEARWIVGQIETLAGLKLPSQVVLQNLGSDLGPPPQRDPN